MRVGVASSRFALWSREVSVPFGESALPVPNSFDSVEGEDVEIGPPGWLLD